MRFLSLQTSIQPSLLNRSHLCLSHEYEYTPFSITIDQSVIFDPISGSSTSAVIVILSELASVSVLNKVIEDGLGEFRLTSSSADGTRKFKSPSKRQFVSPPPDRSVSITFVNVPFKFS